jgi:hypothetical protein
MEGTGQGQANKERAERMAQRQGSRGPLRTTAINDCIRSHICDLSRETVDCSWVCGIFVLGDANVGGERSAVVWREIAAHEKSPRSCSESAEAIPR